MNNRWNDFSCSSYKRFICMTDKGKYTNSAIRINPLISTTICWHILLTTEEELWFGDFGIQHLLFFKILIANEDMHASQYFYILKLSLFWHLSLCTVFQKNALGLLNLNMLKFLGYHNRFLRYLQKRVDFFNSAFIQQTFLNF
jgi:hypothetical protein